MNEKDEKLLRYITQGPGNYRNLADERKNRRLLKAVDVRIKENVSYLEGVIEDLLSPKVPALLVANPKDRIPWKKDPSDLRKLLAFLIQNRYIRNGFVDAVIGHFDVAEAPAPAQLIVWAGQNEWEIGAFFAALSAVGALGPRRKVHKEGVLVEQFPPAGSSKWAFEHFAGIKNRKAFYENCRKAKRGDAVNTFRELLADLGIK
jgi:hypothetical protein